MNIHTSFSILNKFLRRALEVVQQHEVVKCNSDNVYTRLPLIYMNKNVVCNDDLSTCFITIYRHLNTDSKKVSREVIEQCLDIARKEKNVTTYLMTRHLVKLRIEEKMRKCGVEILNYLKREIIKEKPNLDALTVRIYPWRTASKYLMIKYYEVCTNLDNVDFSEVMKLIMALLNYNMCTHAYYLLLNYLERLKINLNLDHALQLLHCLLHSVLKLELWEDLVTVSTHYLDYMNWLIINNIMIKGRLSFIIMFNSQGKAHTITNVEKLNVEGSRLLIENGILDDSGNCEFRIYSDGREIIKFIGLSDEGDVLVVNVRGRGIIKSRSYQFHKDLDDDFCLVLPPGDYISIMYY